MDIATQIGAGVGAAGVIFGVVMLALYFKVRGDARVAKEVIKQREETLVHRSAELVAKGDEIRDLNLKMAGLGDQYTDQLNRYKSIVADQEKRLAELQKLLRSCSDPAVLHERLRLLFPTEEAAGGGGDQDGPGTGIKLSR